MPINSLSNGFRAAAALAALLMLLVPGAAPRAAEAEALWQALGEGGHIALMRHAEAPGTGDPAEFALRDCATQRNLDADGRAQARRTGAAFRDRGVTVGRVFSSQWCRCLETARLLDLGPVEELPALNSFFRARERAEAQTAALRAVLAGLDPDGPSHVMVTHQVNITALTGVFPRSGEIVVLRLGGQGGAEVAGRIPAL